MIEVERIISVDQERRSVTGVIQEPKSERKLGGKSDSSLTKYERTW